MKLTCDLCGGSLQMNAGGQEASCKNCGLCYSLDTLREKLRSGSAPQNKPVETPQISTVPTPVATPIKEQPVAEEPQLKPIVSVTQEPQLKPVAAPAAEQFVMPVECLFAACLAGTVQQGCIGVGETVYIDGDYSKPYRMYRFGNDPEATHVSAGQYTRLFLVPNRRDLLKNARVVTGALNPTENAYRFNGSVEGYFEDLLRKNFAEYTLKKQMEWPGLKIPVTFMLMKNYRPVLALFIFDSHDAKSRYQAEKAQEILGSAFIRCTHFYKDYRNDEPYVVDRIRDILG